MLKKETLAEVAKRAGIKAEDLQTALTSETEVEVQLPEVVTYLKPDFDIFQANLKKSGYDEGKVAGEEMSVKAVKTAKNLTFEGKSVSALVDFVIDSTKKEAGVEPDAKYKTLEQKYNDLRTQKESEINLLKNEKETLSRGLFETRVIDQLTSSIEGETIIPKKQIAALFRMENEIVEQDGGLFVKRNGDLVKDEKLQPIPAINLFKENVDKQYLKKAGIGLPGDPKKDDKGALLFTSQSEWREYWQKKGEPTTGAEAQKSLIASMKQTGFKHD